MGINKLSITNFSDRSTFALVVWNLISGMVLQKFDQLNCITFKLVLHIKALISHLHVSWPLDIIRDKWFGQTKWWVLLCYGFSFFLEMIRGYFPLCVKLLCYNFYSIKQLVIRIETCNRNWLQALNVVYWHPHQTLKPPAKAIKTIQFLNVVAHGYWTCRRW